MDHFEYRDGALYAEQVPISEIAAAVGTPFYCYSTATVERHYRVFEDALSGIDSMLCYSVKANSNLAIVKTLARLGAGADVVSGGELVRALRAGIPAAKIVFSGVGKTAAEIRQALEAKILQINVESVPELTIINQIAGECGVVAPIALRINPDVDAQTHTKVATGRLEDKFGIEWPQTHEIVNGLAEYPNVQLVGLAMHIGSQLTNLDPFRAAFTRMRELVSTLASEGHQITTVDLGGGLGIPYESAIPPGPDAYAEIVKEVFAGADFQLLFEPGRLIVGNAGILVTRVIFVKEGSTKRFAIVDAAMNDLMRPTLYDAKHEIIPVQQPETDAKMVMSDIVGPVCETGDKFAENVSLPLPTADDLLAIRSAGAYGAVMASSYNTRALVPEVLVRDDAFSVVRRRVEVEDLLGYEELPAWLSNEQSGDAAAE